MKGGGGELMVEIHIPYWCVGYEKREGEAHCGNNLQPPSFFCSMEGSV